MYLFLKINAYIRTYITLSVKKVVNISGYLLLKFNNNSPKLTTVAQSGHPGYNAGDVKIYSSTDNLTVFKFKPLFCCKNYSFKNTLFFYTRAVVVNAVLYVTT
jgi:hypothetical protein